MQVKIYKPHPTLREYVLNISTVNAILPDRVKSVVNPYPPTPFQSLMFYCGNPVYMGRGEDAFEKQPLTVLVGPQLSRVNIRVHQKLNAIRVDFLPGGMYRLLGIPMIELADGGFDAHTFFGPEIQDINDQLSESDNLEEGKHLVETFLLRRILKFTHRLPIDVALNTMLRSEGVLTIEKAASLACMSIRQFERKSLERLGMNPKMYSRILKFSKAYRLHEAFANLTWTQIAYDAGYFDQMHMIRDFRMFAGANPSIVKQQLHTTPIRMQKDLLY